MSRTIVVAVGGTEADLSTLGWVASEADDGDTIHIVFAYPLLSSCESSWQPLVAANDQRRQHARHVVGTSTQVVRALRPGIDVGGSAIVGRAMPVLADTSAVADLIVVSGTAATDGAPIASGLARRAECPVVVVPRSFQSAGADAANRPVALLMDTIALPTAAVDFAFAAAAHRRVELIVAEPTQPAPGGLPVCDDDISQWEPLVDSALPIDLAAWRDRYRDAGVIVEVRRESALMTAHLMHRTCQLLVASRGPARTGPLGQMARTALRDATCPVAIVLELAG